MNAIVRETIKQWLPDSWEEALSEVEDEKKIEFVFLDLIKQCMPAEDFELFSLVTKTHNDLIDEEKEEEEIENYIATHDLDDDFNIEEQDFPLSNFNIDFQKFGSLVLKKYNWIFEHHADDISKYLFTPELDMSCDSYIHLLAFNIDRYWGFIKSSIIHEHNKKIKEEALSILNRKWEEITEEDYQKAIEMLKSVNAYNELIEVLSTGIYIKGENGWKVKRSDKIDALRIEEEASKKDNVTLKDWVNLLGWDYNSGINPENTNQGILKKLYNEGSGLAALILGDDSFDWVRTLIYNSKYFVLEMSEDLLKDINVHLKKAVDYYQKASERNCAIGYRVCALIYKKMRDKEQAKFFEEKYQQSPYDYKRVSFNLDNEFKKELESEFGNITTRRYFASAPLSVIALNEQQGYKYLTKVFKGFDIKLLQIS